MYLSAKGKLSMWRGHDRHRPRALEVEHLPFDLSDCGIRVSVRPDAYLQNTLEQFALFAPGLLGLAWYADAAGALRAVPATAITWIATRYAFWVGYHCGAAYRAAGVPGLIIPLILLLYVAARFGNDLAGLPGAIVPVALYVVIELVLFRATRAR